jgi:sec-independent protein translocase protein TatB
MFNIGIGELLFIAILVLVFIGPERLPKIMRQLGEYTAQIRAIIRSFNQEFAEELRPLHEIRGLADELNPTKQLGNLIDPDVQRPAPKRTPPPVRTTNPMAQISQSTTNAAAEPTIAPPHASGERPPNPIAQISQQD